MKKIFAGLFILICTLSLFACQSSNKKTFGFFTHNGYALTSFTSEDLTYQKAKDFISSGTLVSLNSTTENTDQPLTDSEIDTLLLKYGSVSIKTTYWEDGIEDPLVQTSTASGTDLEKMLKTNTFTICTGMLVKNIIITETLLGEYEQANEEFAQDPDKKYAPFNEVYSYHKNEKNLFVLQTNDYARISAETYGGVTATFVQQNETLFNENNLISKFQSSFGIQFQSPGNTVNQGTVLEVEFTWNLK